MYAENPAHFLFAINTHKYIMLTGRRQIAVIRWSSRRRQEARSPWNAVAGPLVTYAVLWQSPWDLTQPAVRQ